LQSHQVGPTGAPARAATESGLEKEEGGQMNPVVQVIQQPFVQLALPIMATIIVAAWLNGKGMDAINRRLDAIEVRLGRIEERLTALERKVDALELKAWR
jgi:hypothetical protein